MFQHRRVGKSGPKSGLALGRAATLAGGIAVAGVGALAAGAPLASASPVRSVPLTRVVAGGKSKTTNTPSTSNAGYLGNVSGSTTLSVSIKVPKFTCAAGDNPVFIGAYANGSADDNPTGSGENITVNCNGTTASYSASVFADDGPGQSLTVVPGDTVSLSATISASSETDTITDTKTHQSATVTGTGMAVNNLQLTTQGGFGDTGGFAKFHTIKYADINVNGEAFSTLNPTGLNQVDGNGKIMIEAKKIVAAGTAFSLSFKSDS
jgi:hypothetical protein